MSKATQVTNTGQFVKTNYDTSKIFIWDNRFANFTYVNGTGSAVNLSAGQIMGVISANGRANPLASAAVDGSQIPVGILTADRTVANGETVTLSVCIAGDVAEEAIVFSGADTFNSVVSSETLRNRLVGKGIRPIASTQMTKFDN